MISGDSAAFGPQTVEMGKKIKAGDEESSPALPRLLAIVGPTAAGKSRLALECARRLDLPLLSCDSVQVYRGLDIGSAKASVAQRRDIPHHLVDVVDADCHFSAGDYLRLAWPLLRRRPCLLAGGTGLYLRTLAWTQTRALADLEPRFADARAGFEKEWMGREEKRAGSVHAALQERDPATAADIHPRNVVRALRALWLCLRLDRPISEVRREDPPRLRVQLFLVVLDPGQAPLSAAIARRCDQMLEAGWLDEVRMLRARGYDTRFKSMGSLGYRQLLEHLEGRFGLGEAVAEIKRATIQYARRQRIYFRHQLPAQRSFWIRDPAEFPWAAAQAFVEGQER